MKKIFIVFLTILIMVTCLALPAAAAMPEQFGEYNNLFDSSSTVTARFYDSPTSYQNNNFYSVNLIAGQPYTFVSSQGSNSFYAGEEILYNNYISVFSFSSSNLLSNQPLESRGGTYIDYTFSQNFNTSTSAFKIQAFNGLSYIKTIDEFYVSSLGVSSINFIKDSSFNTLFIGFNGSSSDIGLFFDVSNLTNDSEYYLFINFLNLDLNSKQWNQMIISKDSSSSWMPGYAEPFYNNNLTYFYTFTPSVSGIWLIGINDLLAGSSENTFSSLQSSENEFYLLEGALTPGQVSEIIDGNNYQNGYNSGFNEGYKEGEHDGLNSSNFMENTILTIFSAPFVIAGNALNFDLFGINLYNLFQIILTVLIIAFVITKLKGRE